MIRTLRWPAAPIAVDVERATAWLHRQILFEHEPLERVAAEFNRYTPKPIEIVSPALQHLEISGVFATDDTEAFIAFLRSLEGVRVEVTTTRIRVSQD
jgi:transmembrane sensor